MTKIKFHIIFIVFILFGINSIGLSKPFSIHFQQSDTTKKDSVQVEKYEPSYRPTYQPSDRFGDPFTNTQSPSPLLLQDPSNLSLDLEIDTGMNYTIYERIGDLNYRPRTTMTFEQFERFQDEQMHKQYFKDRSSGLDGESAVSARRLIPKLYISPVFDRIFGGNYVDITPTGFVNLDFGGRWQTVENPNVPVNQQRNGGFNYNQQISMNVVGKVGEKLAVTANFDNNNTFDYQNNLKIEYTGYEEDIIKKIEIGNVSMPVANSLMSGGQSLFGVKTQLQFGKLYVTGLASRQQGSTKTQTFNQGTGDVADITGIRVSEYDEYKHFFLGHFFRDNYNNWLSNLPQVTSGVMISNIQVYVVRNNRGNQTSGLRSIVALADLGEAEQRNLGSDVLISSGSGPTTNDAQVFFSSDPATPFYDKISNDPAVRSVETAPGLLEGLGLSENTDFAARAEIRKLEATEYDVKDRLGYITLRSPLNEGEILAVAYEYTYNGERFTVGELQFSNQSAPKDEALVLKLLKPTSQNLDKPIWDLAMKNIYSLPGARNLNESDFKLQIVYDDNTSNYRAPNLNEGTNTNNIPLLQVLKLDQLNRNQDPQPDANFDFIEDVTFDVDNGAIIFPVKEPFGETLEEAFTDQEQDLKDKYVFQELYNGTQVNARQNSLKNKFELIPEYQGRSQREYLLEGFNVLEGSVVVTSGSQVLIEGQHYQVSYLGGARVTIVDDGILNSGSPITISYEEADMFNFRSRWLTGARFDYQFNDKINMGATVMHLSERTAGISRYAIGNEPVKNTKYGFDVNFQEDSRVITKVLDALPLISTKETSTVTFNGEFAQLLSGTTNEVNGKSTSYVDDFESAATTFNLGGGHQAWSLGSTPVNNPDFDFDMSSPEDSLGLGYRRARLAWYQIDQTFYNSGQPDYIQDELANSPYVSVFYPQQLFNIDLNVVNAPMSIFNLAYYPRERGQYNFNNRTEDFDPNGFFRRELADQNFASITRMVPTNFDFNRNNVEYIEFWLMDPFQDEEIMDGERPSQPSNSSGGKLYFNLGEVSEDVLEDNLHAFENGLPADGSDIGVRQSKWGRVTEQNFLTPFFDTDPASRANQDVGLDGLSSINGNGENYFEDQMAPLDPRSNASSPLQQNVFDELSQDFSSDDYQFYLDPAYDGAGVLERYKKYNGLENNSPAVSQNNAFSSSATTIPDNEDLNEDNFVSQEESYFEYELELTPGTMNVEHPYIVDKVTSTPGSPNGANPGSLDKDWYLFRIPIQNPTRTVGQPSFNFLRYIRMYMAGWNQPIVLRMTDFRMVASQWRKFNGDLSSTQFGVVPEPADPDFSLSVVGVQQNGQPAEGKPPYKLPPGITQDLDNTTAVTRRNDEQSLQLCVDELEDGDARATFKAAINFDLVNYGRLKMFLHAQNYDPRGGTSNDLQDGDLTAFLRLSRDESENYYEIEVPLTVTPDDQDAIFYTPRAIWPLENEIDLALNELYTLKSARNRDQEDVTVPYSRQSNDGQYNLTIRGNPKLSDIQYMMIGVRNPIDSLDEDRGSHSACVWANELRVTDFDDQNGWAANARINLKLADFANISASTQYSTFGFGQIQDRISDRTREEIFKYDVSANVNVDKLIPWKTGVKIPMFVSYSNSTETPRFDPLDSDVPLDASLDKFETDAEKEDYKKKVVSQRTSRAINFIDVRKEKVKEDAKSHVYDIENFSFSYSYSDDVSSNQNTAEMLRKRYSGSVAWAYSPKPLSIEPFKESKAFSSPYLQLIKDINFVPLPNNFSVRASVDRNFTRTQLRNADLTTIGIQPNYEKLFYFDRTYNMRWNIFKNLAINYNAQVNAIIDEADGDIDTQEKRDEIWNNIKSLGRTKNFSQSMNANYRIPLDKIPITDWISSDYRYSLKYDWIGTNRNQIETFGNTGKNERTQDLTGKFDLVKLYNKSEMLRKINSPPRRSSRRTQADTTRQMSSGMKSLLRLLMSVRSFNITMSKREGTTLPGLEPTPYLMGMDDNWESPGWGFIFGSQDPNVRFTAADNDWLVRSPTLTTYFEQYLTEELNMKASVEPLKDLKIQLDMRRSVTSRYQELYRWDSLTSEFVTLSPQRTGSYMVTFLPIATSFIGDDSQNNSSVFEEFVANREVILARLNQTSGAESYAINSQDVLVPAFIAAYSGKNVASVSLTPFPKFPMPNWRMDYAGLSKLNSLKDIFSSVNITHAYSSTFDINNYRSANIYSESSFVDQIDLTNSILEYPLGTEVGDDGTLVPIYNLDAVSISERFSPLVGLNLRSRGGVSIKAEYNRERKLILDLSNSRVTEIRSGDITLDFGVSKNEWKVPFKIQGRTAVINNEMQFRFAFTVRDTRTLLREIEQNAVIQDGNINYQIRPQISYVANQRLNLTMYFEKTINEPRISNRFNQSTSAFGVQVRFSLAQ